jgi:HemK-like putative methylase
MRDLGGSEIPEEYRKGFAMFLGCKIGLSRRPLIPRPETEFWTQRAIADMKNAGSIHMLDIFSGSGCVGIAAAKRLPGIKIDLADIDPAAVEQIKINLDINGIAKDRARVFESDIFTGIPRNTRYDAILANPPYIDPARIGEVQRAVLDYEPHRALFAGKSGLEIIEKFLKQAKYFLKTGGFTYIEFDPLQKDCIGVTLKKEKYSSFEFFKDQFVRWRFAKIVK